MVGREMNTTFYIRVPICRRNGIGDHKVGFTWFQKLPEYFKLMAFREAEITDEYGRIYNRTEFAGEVAKSDSYEEEIETHN